MDATTDRRLWDRASQLRLLLLSGDLSALAGLADPAFWQRAGQAELTVLARHATEAAVLGVLGRRSLMHVLTPGAAYPHYVVEQQWSDAGGLVEDERLFVLVDRSEVMASGDVERIERLRTKLAAQEAAQRYARALESGDAAAVEALWSRGFAEAHAAEVRPRIGLVRSAQLIGSVGPRTLVRCLMAGGEETAELLWREHDGGWLVEGARTFRPPDPPGEAG
jgi:hypothetical protein